METAEVVLLKICHQEPSKKTRIILSAVICMVVHLLLSSCRDDNHTRLFSGQIEDGTFHYFLPTVEVTLAIMLGGSLKVQVKSTVCYILITVATISIFSEYSVRVNTININNSSKEDNSLGGEPYLCCGEHGNKPIYIIATHGYTVL